MERNWDDNYNTGDTPWDCGFPDPLLVETVESALLKPGKALEIGCGTGTNAAYLARQGFDVLAIDLSPTAIERARTRNADPRIRYEVLDVLTHPLPAGPYDSVFDRGCFHVFGHVEERRTFVRAVAEALNPGGHWLSLIGSTEGAPRDHGPPRRSALEVVSAVELWLEVICLRATTFTDVHGSPPAWLGLFRRRTQGPQPSTAAG